MPLMSVSSILNCEANVNNAAARASVGDGLGSYGCCLTLFSSPVEQRLESTIVC